MKEPVARSDLRLALGGAYYGTLRKLLWIKERSSFTRERCEAILPYSAASHKTPLMRRLRDVVPLSSARQSLALSWNSTGVMPAFFSASCAGMRSP